MPERGLGGQEGRVTEHGDAETGGSRGGLSPMSKLCLVALEVPGPLPRRGQAPHWEPQNMLPSRVLSLLNQ